MASEKKPELKSIDNLDELREIISFIPVTSTLLKKAAYIWASARSQGIPTADEKSLDVDIIICTHWQIIKEEFPGRYTVFVFSHFIKYTT